MSEKPIIFKPEMVKAILEGTKTQTRRIIQPQPKMDSGIIENGVLYRYFPGGIELDMNNPIKCPYGKPGDILWVREKHCNVNKPGIKPDYYYFADTLFPECEDYDPKEWTWKPSIHMKREAARLFLDVKSIRVERLHKITPEDCVNEGSVKRPHYMKWGGEECLALHKRYKEEFAKLWDSINAKRGYSWESNPWVWVIEFVRVGR